MNTLQQLKDRVVDGYLSYKLNAAQLSKLSVEVEGAEAGKLTLDALTKDVVSVEKGRGKNDTSKDGLKDALDSLGVTKMVDSLGQDKPWTLREKSAYRRLHTPDAPATKEAPEKRESGAAFANAAVKMFPSLDADHNGNLTMAEIDRGMANKDFNGTASGVLVTERMEFDKLTKNKDGITLTDLQNYGSHGLSKLSDSNGIANEFAVFTQRADKLAASPVVPIEQEHISHFDFKQANAGTCVEMSTIAGSKDSVLQSMFHTNDDGTITVHFADGKDEKVTDVSLTERTYHARGLNNERWPAVLEMAMGQRLAEGQTGNDALPRTAMDGQDPNVTLKAFTGKDTEIKLLDKMSLNRTREVLTEALATGEPVLAGSRNKSYDDQNLVGLEKLHNGIVNNHAYAVLGYDAKSDQVTLRNPWHHKEWVVSNDGKDDGIFQMPLADFSSSYRRVMYTTTQA